MEIGDINKRIKKEICYDTINKLKDENLLIEYKKAKSVNNSIIKLNNVLSKHKINDKIKKLIIDEYLLDLIPPGTKGVIRGNKFNSIIKNRIENYEYLLLNKNRFEIYFEKQDLNNPTTEKPDWFIHDKKTNKTIIGMNQLDLWSGGQQLNRGSKYLLSNQCFINNKNDNCKLICVVCNEINFKNNKNKCFKLFQIGFKDNSLCYLLNLENLIKEYFS
ncbi:hypothetical protein [Chlorella virus XW01]|nr:hypothetical protein [Chlorella virus XW01]